MSLRVPRIRRSPLDDSEAAAAIYARANPTRHRRVHGPAHGARELPRSRLRDRHERVRAAPPRAAAGTKERTIAKRVEAVARAAARTRDTTKAQFEKSARATSESARWCCEPP